MSKQPVTSNASNALDKFKMEVAQELGIDYNAIEQSYADKNASINNQMLYNKISNAGNIGGEMVKRMIESTEKKMADQQQK